MLNVTVCVLCNFLLSFAPNDYIIVCGCESGRCERHSLDCALYVHFANANNVFWLCCNSNSNACWDEKYAQKRQKSMPTIEILDECTNDTHRALCFFLSPLAVTCRRTKNVPAAQLWMTLHWTVWLLCAIYAQIRCLEHKSQFSADNYVFPLCSRRFCIRTECQ